MKMVVLTSNLYVLMSIRTNILFIFANASKAKNLRLEGIDAILWIYLNLKFLKNRKNVWRRKNNAICSLDNDFYHFDDVFTCLLTKKSILIN